jgi:hypothetical protein
VIDGGDGEGRREGGRGEVGRGVGGRKGRGEKEGGRRESKHAGLFPPLDLTSKHVRTLEEVVVDGQAVLLGDEL